MPRRHAAFISYASPYRPWAEALRQNLEACLHHHGHDGARVFLDDKDLAAGYSFVGQLQEGLAQAERLILVTTPEALASPWVETEWHSFLGRDPDARRGRLLVAELVPTPLPPFLDDIQRVSFAGHDDDAYRAALAATAAFLLGHRDRRRPPDLPPALTLPEPPRPELPPDLRSELLAWIGPKLATRKDRRAVAAELGLPKNALDD